MQLEAQNSRIVNTNTNADASLPPRQCATLQDLCEEDKAKVEELVQRLSQVQFFFCIKLKFFWRKIQC